MLHAATTQNRDGRDERQQNASRSLRTSNGDPLADQGDVAVLLSCDAPDLDICTEFDNTTMHAIEGVYNSTLSQSQVILSTALVKIQDFKGYLHECRALLDSGAQSNFITQRMCNRLNLKTTPGNFCISGVGKSTSKIRNKASVVFYSSDGTYNKNLDCLVLPNITDDLPTVSFSDTTISIPQGMKLADDSFNKKNPIDLLIGSSAFWELLCTGKYKVQGTDVILQETFLGWIVGGSVPLSVNVTAFTADLFADVSYCALDGALTRFWEIDEAGLGSMNERKIKESEDYCEAHFKETFQRNKDGMFVVSIPFKENLKNLGESREKALKYFYSLESKLQKKPELNKEYIRFMNEYLVMGHMSEVNENLESERISYYMPHHAVVREDSTTTKLRVVFNGSMKTDTGLSLNDVQHVGRTIQDELLAILLRFRKHEYVMTADVSKIYGMILVKENQRCLQRVFWRSSPLDELKVFELNTVTYGTASAPFLAVRCLTQLALENIDTYPEASHSIRNSFYMDDYLEGAESEEQLIKLQREVSGILSSTGLELRKWLCNKKELCERFRLNRKIDSSIVTIGENEPNKTLGVLWNAYSDNIQFSINNVNSYIITKRSILSLVAQVYDPLSLLSPVIIIPKLLIQSLWQSKVGWDDKVSPEIESRWLKFIECLPSLKLVKVPRKVVCSNYTRIELHGFGDASQRAYGCCIYIRCINENGECSSTLLCSKSRVAPIKQVTLPRLELCSALLLARLAHKVIQYLNINFNKLCFWSDSQITLAWIQGSSNRWKTFVANRVGEIQQLTNVKDWYHVKSQDNPADLISRGVSGNDIIENKFWWNGPHWLLDSTFKPAQFSAKSDLELPEQRLVVNTVLIDEGFNLFSKFSNLNKLTRVCGYCLRFISNLKCKKLNVCRKSGFLSVEEVKTSINELIKIAQKEAFPVEYSKLINNQPISRKSPILSLDPIFIDNIIRVGGRLQNSSHAFDKKHPIILPKNHVLTTLILNSEHKRLMYCGPTLLLSSIREKYWPICGRSQVRKLVRKCVICFKINPKPSQYIMGQLPESRVNQYVPFYNTGCDMAGPFLLKDRTTRGAKLVKGYVCIFVCMATKAIHLEVLSDLTTPCFLAAFKRFIARRGKPLNMYSDNGTTFVGADRELKNLHEFVSKQNESIDFNHYFSEQGIAWHFIPARSPNFGGIWEAGVKSFKFHFKRVVGEAHLCYEDFVTVLVQIEAILNSRPICPLSSSPDQLNPLTPAHFLIGRSITALPEREHTSTPENRLKRFQRLQQILQHFWQRWHLEYPNELQTRSKWTEDKPNIDIGTLVLVSDENAPPLKWPVGRIQDLHPGKDGVVRVATVKLKEGTFTRPLTKLCPLPVDINKD